MDAIRSHMNCAEKTMEIRTIIMGVIFSSFLFSSLMCSSAWTSSSRFICRPITAETKVQISSGAKEDQRVSEHVGEEVKILRTISKHLTKPFCDFSHNRSDVCDMKGDIRIHGTSFSIFFISPNKNGDEIVRIRPYPRKFDLYLMERIVEIRITSTGSPRKAHKCTVNHKIPAIIFSTGGLLGNFYHDFNDALIPLFITSRQFHGDVQFVIANMKPWWIEKYKGILQKLSSYEPIDLNNENRVHCYPHAIVNLHSHKKISIDPYGAPNNYSSAYFAKFLRESYSLDRELVVINQRKPRLLIITRRHTRQFINIKEIILMAEELGYEVVAQETLSKVEDFAKIVNSCDVMMGVHGAGLTNFIFLPDKAVHIQIAPLGKPSSREDFGYPAIDRNLNYIQYDISEEESTLVDLYPRNHPVFTDPDSIYKQGYSVSSKIYLVDQSVKLNVTRFRPVLVQALELLHTE